MRETIQADDWDALVDIREISVRKELPKEERIAAFIEQIKNPYRFRCGDFVVNACFSPRGGRLKNACRESCGSR